MPVVKFYFADPFFAFDASFVPEGHFLTYEAGSTMYDFLNSHLLPSDIDSIRIEADGVNSSVVIFYRLRDEVIENLPPFHAHHADCDIPF